MAIDIGLLFCQLAAKKLLDAVWFIITANCRQCAISPTKDQAFLSAILWYISSALRILSAMQSHNFVYGYIASHNSWL